MAKTASIELLDNTLHLRGNWTVRDAQKVSQTLLKNIILPTYPIFIDTTKIKKIDTTGVYLIKKIEGILKQANVNISFVDMPQKQKQLFDLVNSVAFNSHDNLETGFRIKEVFKFIGQVVVEKFFEACLWMSFIGEFAIESFALLKKPRQIPWKSIINVIEFTGIRSMPIIAFLAFLIGVVLAYQIGVQLETYGANIFIINFLGIAIMREFGPLITAIILAGRVTSAFTAHIGLMKANEELDALKTMGLSTTELLIMPRIVGMLIAMPLLIVWCDMFGLFGGMFMAKVSLNITFATFFTQFPQVVTLPNFLIGLAKAPAFAIIVASVGCFHGLRVSGSADSIGQHTTKSVVLAIFLIIIADALFSIVLSWLGV